MRPIASTSGMETPYVTSLVFTFLVSVLVCTVILVWARLRPDHASHANKIQSVHEGKIPRIGGLAIGLALPVAVINFFQSSEHPLLYQLLLAALPLLIFGLIEDLTQQVSVMVRLWAAIVSGVLACLILGVTLNRLGIGPIDDLLEIAPLAIGFTAFATAGLASSINMIDGLNGLSSTTVVILLLAMAAIGYRGGGVADILAIIMLIECAIAGFWLFNWPWGRIFLGDGGAYLLGFLVAWIAILLHARLPQTSAFAFLVVCAYPIIETLGSIVRRLMHRHHIGLPDQHHLHHWILFHVKYSAGVPKSIANSVAGILCALLAVPGAILGLWHSGSTATQTLFFVLLCVAYALLYIALQRWGRAVALRQGLAGAKG